MDTQEIIASIAKLKTAIEKQTNPDVKAKFEAKLKQLESQLAASEAKVEKQEQKAAAQEKKEVSKAEEDIKKLEAAIAKQTNPDIKAKFEKKLAELKGTLKDVKEEIKEEKKEIAEQKKEIKQAAKEVKSAQKEVRKTAIKKVAKKKVERKKVEVKKTKRKEKLQRVLSDLDAMIEKNKKLKSKYGSGYKGTGKPSDLERDAGRKAKPFGYRFVGKHDYRVPTEMQIKRGLKRGTIDYEARPNRADVNPDKKVKLAHGGNVKDSAVVALVTAQEYDKKSKEFVGKERVEKIRKGNEVFSDAFNRHTPFAESTQERMVKDRYEAFWNMGNPDKVVKVKKVEITKEGRMPHHYADGGMMKKGGKVGTSKEDRARYAKPAGWRWKEEAVTRRVIERKQLSMQPSKKMREKYPDLVYYEDRLNKADKKPTRTSADSI